MGDHSARSLKPASHGESNDIFQPQHILSVRVYHSGLASVRTQLLTKTQS